MEIKSIGALQTPAISLHKKGDSKPTVSEAQDNFSSSLKNAIDELNKSQVVSDKTTAAFANGQIDNLHDVMITAEKASITLQTAVEIQRKVIDAYKEVMRMQV